MNIYTRTGDDGTTALFGGKRISKDNPIVESYGTLDELTSYLGVVLEYAPEQSKPVITKIQKNLYKIMSVVSGVKHTLEYLSPETKSLETEIDAMTRTLPKLNKFILPQGTMAASHAHVARTICRRAERRLVAIQVDPHILRYVNRLSDYLFTLARYVSDGKEVFA